MTEKRSSPGEEVFTSIQPYVSRQELAGAVMFVADKNGMLALEAAGWADRTGNRKMAPDTLFWIASQTKPMTAVAFMMLVEEGKLNLDDPVEKYLPEFAGQMVLAEKDADHVLLRKTSHPITIKSILTHTSGMPFRNPVEEPTLDELPLSARVRAYAMSPLLFDPGTGCVYSNEGINTAGRIAEVLSGQSFEQFMDERLLGPLGMTDTSFYPTDEQLARLAKPYKANPETGGLEESPIDQLLLPLSDSTKRFCMPAGGLFSTARDVAIFYRMILNKGSLDGRNYLREETVREMTRRQIPAAMGRAQGYGFEADEKSFGHGGAYGSDTRVDRDSGLILGWLVQHASYNGDGANAKSVFEKAAFARFGSGSR